MSKENVEAFKRGLGAGNRGDVDALLDELHPEISGTRRCSVDGRATDGLSGP
jgi:hypothetical protein